uniref:Uncharacterized protein n=1 Tax=viral metagenome TaxID=1070528 RepID=A0A6C0JS73_9ZZZZ
MDSIAVLCDDGIMVLVFDDKKVWNEYYDSIPSFKTKWCFAKTKFDDKKNTLTIIDNNHSCEEHCFCQQAKGKKVTTVRRVVDNRKKKGKSKK